MAVVVAAGAASGVGHVHAPGWIGDQWLLSISRWQADGQQELIAEGVEQFEPQKAVVAGAPISWRERRLVIHSHQLAQAGRRALRTRLAEAQTAIAALNEGRRGQ